MYWFTLSARVYSTVEVEDTILVSINSRSLSSSLCSSAPPIGPPQTQSISERRDLSPIQEASAGEIERYPHTMCHTA